MSKDANGYTRYCRIKALLNVAGHIDLRCVLPKTYEWGIDACVYFTATILVVVFLCNIKNRKVVVINLDSHSKIPHYS